MTEPTAKDQGIAAETLTPPIIGSIQTLLSCPLSEAGAFPKTREQLSPLPDFQGPARHLAW
jgi:hypothetical protein